MISVKLVRTTRHTILKSFLQLAVPDRVAIFASVLSDTGDILFVLRMLQVRSSRICIDIGQILMVPVASNI